MSGQEYEQESLFGPPQSDADGPGRTDEGTVTRKLPRAPSVLDKPAVAPALMRALRVRCASEKCRAEIVFVLLARKVRGEERFGRHPVDVAPAPGGTIYVIRDGRSSRNLIGHSIPAAERRGRADLYISHYATCPDADRWRGQGKGKR